MIRLLIESAGRSDAFETAEAVVTIGRTEANALRLADEGLSRQHCRIERLADGSYRVADLASRNGTFVNGRRIDEHALGPGDRIRIGSTTITFAPVGGQDAASPPAEDEAPAEPGAPQALRLLFTAGLAQGKSHTVFGKLTTLGRSPRADLVIADGGVSNRHAEIRRGAEGFVLVDVGSRNGTFLNGHLVTRAPVAPGDQIRIGRAVIQVGDAGQPSAAAPAAPDAATAADTAAAPGPAAAPTPKQAPRGSRRTLLVPAAALLVVGAATLVLFRGALVRWFAPSAARAAGDLLGRRGAFETAEAKLAWLRDDDTEGELAAGHLAILLPPRGPAGRPASFRLAEPLTIRTDRAYAVSARMRVAAGAGSDAALLLTWRGPASWRPRAEVLVWPRAGTEEWAEARHTLVPPAWARSLTVACIAWGRGGGAGFDDISVAARDPGEPLRRLEAGPLVLTLDAPALWSLRHSHDLVAAGAGLVAVRGEDAAPLRLSRMRPAEGFPKLEDGRCELRASATLPGREARRPEVTIQQAAWVRGGAVHVAYRVWASEQTPLDFVGLEFAGPAAPWQTGVDVRTPSGFGRRRLDAGPLVADGVLALAWACGSGKLLVEAAAPVSLDCRLDGERAVCRVGRRALALGPEPVAVELALRGTTGEDERRIAHDLAEAEAAMRAGRLGEAARRYIGLAGRGRSRPEAERARRRLAELRAGAARRAEAALGLLARARLTERAADFAAARAALAPLEDVVAGTPLGETVAAGIAACDTEGRAAGAARREAAAAALLEAAKAHGREGRRHIARLHCEELLAHFAGTRAEAEAKTLVETLDRPPPREPDAREAPPGAPRPAAEAKPPPAPPRTPAIPAPPGPGPGSRVTPPPGPRPDERKP